MTKILNCYKEQTKTRSKAVRLRINLKTFNICLFSIIFAFGFFYLINISDLTVKGFALRELRNEVVNQASNKLENEETVNALQSYYSVNTRAQQLAMVKADNIEYLSLSPAVVAKK